MDAKKPRRDYFVFAILILITAAVYWQVATFDFIQFDDDMYVCDNLGVQAGLNSTTAHWAFTTPYQSNWHPLTWISLMADADASKLLSIVLDTDAGKSDPRLHHLVNLLFHIGSTLLLFIVLNEMTGSRWRSAFVAALFAIHPLHVESVAWIAERKDVLSTFFWMLTMLAYARYVHRPGTKSYALVALAFTLGLLSKPMLVSLPIVLLLLDYWPLRRMEQRCGENSGQTTTWRDLIWEKWPLFVLAAASCAATFWAQRAGGAVRTLTEYSAGMRASNAVVSTIAYLMKMIWPRNLSIFYPHPQVALPVWQVIFSAFLLVACTAIAVIARKKYRYVTIAWAWYLVTLLPVIGLVQVGMQAMADRYTYVTLTGIFIAIAWGIPELVDKLSPAGVIRKLVPILGIFAVAALSISAYSQVSLWRNGVTIFQRAVELAPQSPIAHFNLAVSCNKERQHEDAIRHYRTALKLDPNYIDAHYNLGSELAVQGNYDEAIRHFRAALKLNPKYTQVYINLGIALAQTGKVDEAISSFNEALKLEPSNQAALSNLENAKAAKNGYSQ